MFNRCSNGVRSFARELGVALFLIGLLGFSTNADAVTLATVGSQDTLLDQITQGEAGLPNSSAAAEEAWIESVLGFDIVYNQLSEFVSDGSNWEAVSDGAAGDYGFDFGTGIEPTHYLIKTGGGVADDTHYLYDNNVVMQWAFLNLSDFGENISLTNIGVISHIGTGNGGDTPPGQTHPPGGVPEPITATMGVMAMGALSTTLRRRR